jgi:hypothetical protein
MEERTGQSAVSGVRQRTPPWTTPEGLQQLGATSQALPSRIQVPTVKATFEL